MPRGPKKILTWHAGTVGDTRNASDGGVIVRVHGVLFGRRLIRSPAVLYWKVHRSKWGGLMLESVA